MGWAGMAIAAYAPTVIPAQAGIRNPGSLGVAIGRGVDSRFRGNDGMGRE